MEQSSHLFLYLVDLGSLTFPGSLKRSCYSERRSGVREALRPSQIALSPRNGVELQVQIFTKIQTPSSILLPFPPKLVSFQTSNFNPRYHSRLPNPLPIEKCQLQLSLAAQTSYFGKISRVAATTFLRRKPRQHRQDLHFANN
jgi:hypothetical protein